MSSTEDELHLWIEAEDLKTRKRFFVHKETRKAQWTTPLCLSELVDQLGYPPHPWHRRVSKVTGQVYWRNRDTHESTWERPIPEARSRSSIPQLNDPLRPSLKQFTRDIEIAIHNERKSKILLQIQSSKAVFDGPAERRTVLLWTALLWTLPIAVLVH
jgi:hypothetical protein